jgi:hypothetical protein
MTVLRGLANAKMERREEEFILQNRKGKTCN